SNFREEPTPTIRWLYAELDTIPGSHTEVQGAEVSRCEMNGGVKSPKVFIHNRDDQFLIVLPRGTVYFKIKWTCYLQPISNSEPMNVVNERTFSSKQSSWKRGKLHSDSSLDRNEHDDDVAAADERRCSTPPLMTSTPYTTLERKDRNQMEMPSDGRELRQSQSVPSILCGHATTAVASEVIVFQLELEIYSKFAFIIVQWNPVRRPNL
ncbi:hypothetical protein COOONC_11539, partial [Cooperia oncophora]